MDPRLLSLYEQELRYFRESSAEFARAFPKIAHRLGIEGQEVADPYVERLIEATAFLSARVGLKLDAEYPRFTGHLLDIVYPHFLAPTPSMAVVACAVDPEDANLALGPTLPRGSGLRARQSVGQSTYCEFRTAAALRVWPVEVKRAQYFTYAPDLPVNQHPQARDIRGGLRIVLRATAGLRFDQIAMDDKQHPNAARSVINYGLPMLSGQFTSSVQRVSMEQALKQAILQFEPRILPRTLEVELVMEGSALDSHNRIGLQIRGMLWAQPVPLEFLMRSRVDLEEGRIEIEDMAHPSR